MSPLLDLIALLVVMLAGWEGYRRGGILWALAYGVIALILVLILVYALRVAGVALP